MDRAVMRSRILLPALLLALVLLAPARAATFTISITKSGFNPSAVTVGVGDTVTWTNADTASHQVESKSAGFVSPLLKPGESYSFVYAKAGRFAYQDKAVKKFRGTVTVQEPAEVATVTQTASPTLVVYGATVTLSGAVSSKRSGETVTIFAQPYGQASFAAVGSAISGSDGRWSYLVKPKLRTVYEARWKPATQGTTATSSRAAVRVRPQVGFRVKASSGRVVTFFTKARGVRSFAGKFVYFQRKNAFGQWVSIKKVTLTSTSSATFRVRLPSGRSRVRVFMPATQAGPGYVAGISRTLTLTR
jgi:plastocyanin